MNVIIQFHEIVLVHPLIFILFPLDPIRSHLFMVISPYNPRFLERPQEPWCQVGDVDVNSIEMAPVVKWMNGSLTANPGRLVVCLPIKHLFCVIKSL